jgi:hypothetical protein
VVSGFVTITSTFAPAPEVVVQVSEVAEMNTTGVHALPPTVTLEPRTPEAAATKLVPVPVMVRLVPPEPGPDAGDTAMLPAPAVFAAKYRVDFLVTGAVTTPRFQAIATPASIAGSEARVFG